MQLKPVHEMIEVLLNEAGMSMHEIAKSASISERTLYRMKKQTPVSYKSKLKIIQCYCSCFVHTLLNNDEAKKP